MFQFTVREMFWLITVAALAIGWLIHTHSEQTDEQLLQIQMMDQRLAEVKDIIKQLNAVKEKETVDGKRLANINSLLETRATAGATADQQPASRGWHVRIVHSRLGSEL